MSFIKTTIFILMFLFKPKLKIEKVVSKKLTVLLNCMITLLFLWYTKTTITGLKIGAYRLCECSVGIMFVFDVVSRDGPQTR
jgi:hypothetical protein